MSCKCDVAIVSESFKPGHNVVLSVSRPIVQAKETKECQSRLPDVRSFLTEINQAGNDELRIPPRAPSTLALEGHRREKVNIGWHQTRARGRKAKSVMSVELSVDRVKIRRAQQYNDRVEHREWDKIDG